MFEITARWAGWSKNRGLAYFSASGAWAPGSCPLNNVSVTGSKVPFCDEQWKEEDAGLTKVSYNDKIFIFKILPYILLYTYFSVDADAG